MHEKRAHNSHRLGLLDSSPDPLHAELLLHYLLYHIPLRFEREIIFSVDFGKSPA